MPRYASFAAAKAGFGTVNTAASYPEVHAPIVYAARSKLVLTSLNNGFMALNQALTMLAKDTPLLKSVGLLESTGQEKTFLRDGRCSFGQL